jgi:ubiquinone/menaquinone biosynthesis C-methylase UbiE
MANPFGTQDMALGYANSRPPVHRRVVEQVYTLLERDRPFRRALDIGCGSGVSTRALEGFAQSCVGIEPVEAMVRQASRIAPFASFLAGAAEAIPLGDRSIDFITAAGSLNYTDLDRFFPEAARVLARDGVLAVYDFSPGRSFRDGPGLDDWFADFCVRYPWPRHEARELSPAILAEMRSGFRVRGGREFEMPIPMTRAFYVDYMLTETNVAAAIRRGAPASEIRSWCADSLAAVWNGAERDVVFRGYFTCMSAA